MVEHIKKGRRAEVPRFERKASSIGMDHLDICTTKAISQLSCQSLVDLDCSQAESLSSEHVGRKTRPGTHLKNIVTEITVPNYPWKQISFHKVCPFRAGTKLNMGFVYLNILACVSGHDWRREPIHRLRGIDKPDTCSFVPIRFDEMTTNSHVRLTIKGSVQTWPESA